MCAVDYWRSFGADMPKYKEMINRITIHPSYKSPFVIAEIESAVPISQRERERLKKKIAELDQQLSNGFIPLLNCIFFCRQKTGAN